MCTLSRTCRTAEVPKSSLLLMPMVTELEWQRKQCSATFLRVQDLISMCKEDLETSSYWVDMTSILSCHRIWRCALISWIQRHPKPWANKSHHWLYSRHRPFGDGHNHMSPDIFTSLAANTGPVVHIKLKNVGDWKVNVSGSPYYCNKIPQTGNW